ncbi:MAG: hypothetical protein K6T57_14285 [Thermaceae bacterium]|nr:hypothetical protein [Thermaceae bacterium]
MMKKIGIQLALLLGLALASVVQAQTFTADTSALRGPKTLKGGFSWLRLTNATDQPAYAQLFRLKPGASLTAVQAANAKMQSEHGDHAASLLRVAEGYGGGGMNPKGTLRLGVTLLTGRYALWVTLEGTDGRPEKSLWFAFEVAGTGVASPKADQVIRLVDYGFALPVLKPGRQVWEVRNQGPNIHHLLVFRLAPGKTYADYQAWEKSMQGPPPIEWPLAANVEILSKGVSNFVEVDLKPGNYVITCHISDPNTKQMHSKLGMTAPLTVG